MPPPRQIEKFTGFTDSMTSRATTRRGRGRKAKSPSPPPSEDTSSPSVLRENANLSLWSSMSDDVSFKHRPDTTFDRLMANAKPCDRLFASNSPNVFSDSAESSSQPSTLDDSPGLFRSMCEDEKQLEDKENTKKKPEAKKAANAKPKKKAVLAAAKPALSDRIFSDETHNFQPNFKIDSDESPKDQPRRISSPQHLLFASFGNNQSSASQDLFESRREAETDKNTSTKSISDSAILTNGPNVLNVSDLCNEESLNGVSMSLVTSTPMVANMVTNRRKKPSREISFQSLEEKADEEDFVPVRIKVNSISDDSQSFKSALSDKFEEEEEKQSHISSESDDQVKKKALKSRKTVQIGGFVEQELSARLDSMSLTDRDEIGDVVDTSVVVPMAGKKYRRTLMMRRASMAAHMFQKAFTPAKTQLHDDTCASQKKKSLPIGMEGTPFNGFAEDRGNKVSIRRGRKSILKGAHFDLSIFNESFRGRPSLIEKESPLTTTDKLLSKCSKKEIIHFPDLFTSKVFESSKKIGEGTYGEVFFLPANYKENRDKDGPSPVLKVVPVGGTVQINGSAQTKMEDMLAEIAVSRQLSRIGELGHAENFVQVLDCYLASGPYPEQLLKHWDAYDDEKGSENERPDKELLTDDDQNFIALVFGNGGSDLEGTKLANAGRAVSVFLQVAHALAVAEDLLEFEHRDLHWGNILVRDTDDKSLNYQVGKEVYTVKTDKVKATIIDFTLSRLKSNEDEQLVFYDLAQDPDLFEAEGDYQFDIYRMMRDEVKNKWQEFHPRTNVFWLHYLLDKLIEEVPYKLTKSQLHRKSLCKLRKYKADILDYSSALEFVKKEGTLAEEDSVED